MVKENEVSGKLEWRINIPDGISKVLVPEWRINIPDGTSKVLVPETGLVHKAWLWSKGLLGELVMKTWSFLEKAWNLGVAEPNKVIHGVKGATLCKSINRAMGTLFAGCLAVGVQWIVCKSGKNIEPIIIIGSSGYLVASRVTFSRFIPSVKAQFDHGAMIFIITSSLVSVSGYRVDKLFEMPHQRLLTIAIGTSLCMLISMLFCPIWDGSEQSPEPLIIFGKEDLPIEGVNHTKALYVTFECEKLRVPLVLVDNGSAMNICPRKTADRLGIKEFTPSNLTVRGYDNSSRKVVGSFETVCKLGPIESKVKFFVMNINTTYNLLLGRPWLHSL